MTDTVVVNRPTEVPDMYRWFFARRRLVLAAVFATIGLIALIACWLGVSDTVVIADQLSYIASGGLIGLCFIALAGMAYWADQRDRELQRLGEIETYVFLIAQALNISAESE